MLSSKLKNRVKDRGKLTRADVYEVVAGRRLDKKDKKWKDKVKTDLEELDSEVVTSDVLNKVLKDLDSYDH